MCPSPEGVGQKIMKEGDELMKRILLLLKSGYHMDFAAFVDEDSLS